MTGCILVFGMPRSGTTWVGKLFDSHPDTLYRHEPDSVRRLAMPLYPEADAAAEHRAELERFVASLPGMRSVKVLGKQPLFPKRYLSTAALGAYRASVIGAKAASRLWRRAPCVYRPAGGSRARLVWKSIESPGRLGVCMRALPDACAVHLMRHPCGYIASVLRGEAAGRFGDPRPSAGELWVLRALLATSVGKRSAVRLDDLERLAPEERLAWRWVLTQQKILEDVGRCERVLTVRYEDVCADPLAMTRQMFAFAGLDWQPRTEAFVRASTQASEADFYSVFKRPQDAAQRWRSELDPQAVERVMRIVRDTPLHRFYADRTRVPAVHGEAAG